MFILKMKGEDRYLARKGCGNPTWGDFYHDTTDDPNKALPLGNETTAKTRAFQWLRDRATMHKLKHDNFQPITVEIIAAEIVLKDVVMEIE
jgi:hypothetical protein